MAPGELNYDDAPVHVREDLTASHRRFWRRLGQAGSWWSGSERVAIASEVRAAYDCEFCARRKETLAFGAVEGTHQAASSLPAHVVEVIHRIATDGSRLSGSWYEGVLEQGLSSEQYIEILGTLAALLSIDRFAEAIGVDLRVLPDPEPGDVSQYGPMNISIDPRSGWVPMIAADANDPPDDDLWVRGQVGNVIRAMSLVPDEVRTLNDLSTAHYMAGRFVLDASYSPDRALDRAQIELVAARVSALNECFF